jgi:hypothetical protein
MNKKNKENLVVLLAIIVLGIVVFNGFDALVLHKEV